MWSALDRVQGPNRLKFECLRRNSLLELRNQSITDRYPLNPTLREELLRAPADPYRTELEPNVPSIPGDDPFSNVDQPPVAPKEDASEAEPGADLADEPADAMPDEFGDDLNAEPPAEVDESDPFAEEEMGADDDPFGEEPPSEPPMDEPAVDDADPFADDAGMDDCACGR